MVETVGDVEAETEVARGGLRCCVSSQSREPTLSEERSEERRRATCHVWEPLGGEQRGEEACTYHERGRPGTLADTHVGMGVHTERRSRSENAPKEPW